VGSALRFKLFSGFVLTLEQQKARNAMHKRDGRRADAELISAVTAGSRVG
jgi:hypothetical protein